MDWQSRRYQASPDPAHPSLAILFRTAHGIGRKEWTWELTREWAGVGLHAQTRRREPPPHSARESRVKEVGSESASAAAHARTAAQYCRASKNRFLPTRPRRHTVLCARIYFFLAGRVRGNRICLGPEKLGPL